MQTDGNYDEFAAAYNERNAYNALYERLAALALAGPVAGLRVLHVESGGGAHAAALIAGGAIVIGIDSQAPLEIARERLGPEVTLTRADVQIPLGFLNGLFDIVLASLAMHILRDCSRSQFAALIRIDTRRFAVLCCL